MICHGATEIVPWSCLWSTNVPSKKGVKIPNTRSEIRAFVLTSSDVERS